MKLFFCLGLFASVFTKSALAAVPTFHDEEQMQKRMLEKTKNALMSYDIVEQKTKAALERIQHSAFGKYAQNFAVAVPFVTGKIDLRYKKLNLSYNHFSEHAKLDYNFSDRWKLYYKHEQRDEGVDDRSGVQYSYKF